MTHESDPIGKLLDGLGRLCGQGFSLLLRGEEPDPRVLGAETAAAMATLAAAGGNGDGVQCRPAGADGQLHAIPVSTAQGEGHLVAYPRPAAAVFADPRACLVDALEGAKRLIEERDQALNEARQLTVELNQSYEELYLFSRIATQIRSLHFSQDMLKSLLGEACEAMRVEIAAAQFAEKPGANAVVTAPEIAPDLPDIDAFMQALAARMPASAPAFDDGSHIVTCSADLPPFADMHAKPFRALAIGIRTGEQHFGWLLLVSFNMKEIFRRGEYRLMSTMAQQIALVMANTNLYQDLELFVINLVRSFIMALEAKDLYTRGHSERVNHLCMRMADAMDLDEQQRVDLQWASTLHDLGKIGTPEAILNKPDRLTEPEFDTIRLHPGTGADILKPISQLDGALGGIRHHHERYDGKGYPNHLAGDDIPLLARIIAVADAYDAMTSNRAYRPGRSHDEAMAIIQECAGTQLDPRLVEVFRGIIGTPGHEPAAVASTAGEPQAAVAPVAGQP